VLDLVNLAHSATTEEAADDIFSDGFHVIIFREPLVDWILL
jgi:hypothetical protein